MKPNTEGRNVRNPTYNLADAYRWLAMYESGMTHEEISLEEGVAFNTIGKWLRRLAEYRPRRTGPR